MDSDNEQTIDLPINDYDIDKWGKILGSHFYLEELNKDNQLFTDKSLSFQNSLFKSQG